MIRLALLSLFLLFLWAYAFREWMVSLCGLILLTFLMQKGDMPSQVAEIPGLNPWNITLAIVTLAWLQQRTFERRPWNLSRLGFVLAGGYIGIVVLAYAQAMFKIDAFPPTFKRELAQFLTVDYLVNPLKFLWVALLLADGCHSRRRLIMALGTIVGLGTLYAIMVVKIMPIESLQGLDFMRFRRRIDKEIGLDANDMARVLILTFWSILATQQVWWRTWWSKIGVVVAYVMTFLGIALCYSRSGYLTFIAVGFVLGCVRWRKLLWLGPPALLLLVVLMPSVTARMSMGFDEGIEEDTDWNEVTAGRTGGLWPPIIEEALKAPLFGHGRLAILHTPAYDKILAAEGAVPTTPHNGYLELMVDTGALGLIIVLALFVGVAILSYRLMRQTHDPLVVALGGVGLVHAVGCLANALFSGGLLPSQGLLGALCTFGTVLRVWSGRAAVAQPTLRTSRNGWWHRPTAAYPHLIAPGRIQAYRRSDEPPARMR